MLSALVSASEASIIAVNKIRIKHLSQEGNRRAKLISKIQDNFEDFFATMPKLSHTIKVKNPNTEVENDILLEGLASFFA